MSVIGKGTKLFSNVIKRYFAVNREFIKYLHEGNAEAQTETKKLLKIAIMGLPNAGKSTLINQLVRRPVCASSSKVHTTRVNAFAIYTEGNTQLIYIDTPGLITKGHMKKFKLEPTFEKDVKSSIQEADVVGIMQDMTVPQAREAISKRIINIVPFAKKDTPIILILNKVDMLKNKKILLDVVQKLTTYNSVIFSDIFMLSALNQSGVDDLRNYFLDLAKPTDSWSYDEQTYTNQNTSEIIERVLRAKLLDNVRDEIPYNLKLSIINVDYDEAQNLTALVDICPSKKRHYELIKGNRGRRIRIVALQTEQELCNIFRTGVFIKLNLKELK